MRPIFCLNALAALERAIPILPDIAIRQSRKRRLEPETPPLGRLNVAHHPGLRDLEIPPWRRPGVRITGRGHDDVKNPAGGDLWGRRPTAWPISLRAGGRPSWSC